MSADSSAGGDRRSETRTETAPELDGHASTVSTGVALVPRGGVFEGRVALLGETLLEGTVLGSLKGPGALILGPEARIEGVVECETLSSQGEIVGPIVARRSARFGDGARFDGDLDTPSLEIEGDVVWNGVARVTGPKS